MRALIFFLSFGSLFSSLSHASEKMDYWNRTRRGTNFFNAIETRARMQSARDARIEIVRLTFSKWKSADPKAQDGDFLFGSLDNFEALVEADLIELTRQLDDAHAVGLKVVLMPLSLPGARWKQQNANKLDSRLWSDFRYHEQAARFWKALAARVKNHPAVVGYNVLNEPYPEAVRPRMQDWYTGDYKAWYANVKDTPADLNLFYRTVTRAIREVDGETPIVLDSGFYSTPWAFQILEPTGDARTLYSFHMYEPYAFTSYQEEGKSKYPGPVKIGEAEEPPVVAWNENALDAFLQPVRDFQRRHEIPTHRILAGEFGVARRNTGAPEYLSDLVAVLEKNGWHWAFYSFREDTWTGMDYELGQRGLPAKYHAELEKGNDTRAQYYCANKLFESLAKALGVPTP